MTQRLFALHKVKIFFSFAVLFLSPQIVFSAERCQSLFSETSKPVIGQLRESFQHSTDYTVVLPELTQIKNQCSLGTCHLHAWASALEHRYALENAVPIKISTHFLSARHWLEVSLDTLINKSSAINPDLGATVSASRKAIRTYGIIPDEAWTLNRNFQDANVAKRAQEYIKNIIGQAKWKIQRETDSRRKQEITREAGEQIIEVFDNIIGTIPSEFVYRGKYYTPHSFADRFFPELTNPVVFMGISSSANAKTRVESDRNMTSIQTRLAEVEATARELLDKGQNVYFAYHHNAQFVDSATGIMSIKAFHAPKGFKAMTREQREYFNSLDGGHAVQVVGYDLDPITRRVSKWKIKNSWGEDKGDHGYYHMYADYFEAFAKGISFYRDAGVRLPVAEVIPPKQLSLPF